MFGDFVSFILCMCFFVLINVSCDNLNLDLKQDEICKEDGATYDSYKRKIELNARFAIDLGIKGNQRWVYDRLLGKGQYGKTHLVKTLGDTAMYLVVKEFFNDVLCRTKKEDLVREEAFFLSMCKHEGIPKYHGFNNEFLFMEYVQGPTIDEFKTRYLLERPLERIQFSLNIALKAIEILKYLHKEIGVVHRDIHGRNLMLSENNKLILLDYGLAESIESVNLAKGSLIFNNHVALVSQKKDFVMLLGMLRGLIRNEDKTYPKAVLEELETLLDTILLEVTFYTDKNDLDFLEVYSSKIKKIKKKYEQVVLAYQ